MKKMTILPITEEMQHCIEDCQECHKVCLETVRYCFEQTAKGFDSSLKELLLDCAQICQTTADFMLRGSPLHEKMCVVCATVCKECAESCRAVGGNDPQLLLCEETCEQCYDECQELVHAPA